MRLARLILLCTSLWLLAGCGPLLELSLKHISGEDQEQDDLQTIKSTDNSRAKVEAESRLLHRARVSSQVGEPERIYKQVLAANPNSTEALVGTAQLELHRALNPKLGQTKSDSLQLQQHAIAHLQIAQAAYQKEGYAAQAEQTQKVMSAIRNKANPYSWCFPMSPSFLPKVNKAKAQKLAAQTPCLLW
jgi:hypothetical protein